MSDEHEHKIDAPHVVTEPEYSAIGHVLLAIGITAEPTVVRYRCKLCNKVFAESRDRAVRAKAS